MRQITTLKYSVSSVINQEASQLLTLTGWMSCHLKTPSNLSTYLHFTQFSVRAHWVSYCNKIRLNIFAYFPKSSQCSHLDNKSVFCWALEDLREEKWCANDSGNKSAQRVARRQRIMFRLGMSRAAVDEVNDALSIKEKQRLNPNLGRSGNITCARPHKVLIE